MLHKDLGRRKAITFSKRTRPRRKHQTRILTHTLHIGNLLVSEPLGAIAKIDDPAIGKAFPIEYVLHYHIIPMGIDADVRELLPAPVETGLCNTRSIRSACNPVDSPIKACVIHPTATVYTTVSRLDTGDERKGPLYLFPAHDHITGPAAYVLTDNILRWVSVDPLTKIAAAPHSPLCALENGHDRRYIGLPRAAYRICCRFVHITFKTGFQKK